MYYITDWASLYMLIPISSEEMFRVLLLRCHNQRRVICVDESVISLPPTSFEGDTAIFNPSRRKRLVFLAKQVVHSVGLHSPLFLCLREIGVLGFFLRFSAFDHPPEFGFTIILHKRTEGYQTRILAYLQSK